MAEFITFLALPALYGIGLFYYRLGRVALPGGQAALFSACFS